MTIEEMIQSNAQKYGIDPKILESLIHQESGGNPRAVGKHTRHGTAHGIMQLMPQTAKAMGVKDPFNPEQAIEGGAKYLAGLIDRFGGDVRKALAAYNAGPEAVEEYGDVPPFEETQNYVRNIMKSSGKDSTGEKGVRTYEGTYNGQKIRIDIPGNIKPSNENLGPLFEAEFNRRAKFEQQGKKTIQPLNRSPYERFALGTEKGIESSFGDVRGPSPQFSQPVETGPEQFPKPEPGFHPFYTQQGQENLRRIGAATPQEGPDFVQDALSLIPGYSTIKTVATEGIPEAAGEFVGAGIGSPAALPGFGAENVRQGFRGARAEPGFSKPIAAVGGAAGGAIGGKTASTLGLPYQVGMYPGMALGAATGGRIPAMIRGFGKGFKGVGPPSSGPDVYEAGPYQSPTAATPMTPRLENVVDIRTQPPARPMPGYPTPEVSPGAGAGAPQIPQGREPAIPMPEAKFTSPYERRGVPISHQTGMTIARQPNLPGFQSEGSNVPPSPTNPYQGVLSPEAAGQKLAPNIRREKMISQAKGTEQPQPTVKQLTKVEAPPPKAEVKEISKIKKEILPKAVKEYARVHGLDQASAEKFFRDQGYEIRKRSLKK